MPVMTGSQRINRSTSTTLTRANVKPGQVFVVRKRDGSWSNTKYAALDHNGRFFSLRITRDGDMTLAATDNGKSAVKIVGRWSLNANIFRNGDRKPTTRDRVTDGQLYAVKGGDKTYAHVGQLKDGRLFSMILNSDNHAVTSDKRKNVLVVGTYTLDVKTVA